MILALMFSVFILWFLARYIIWMPPKGRGWPRLIMLHQVSPDEPPSGMNMPPERFEKLLRLLVKKGYRFCTVSELLDDSSGRCVALTFDDGFRDNYLYAFPLLKQYGAKATIYLAPDIANIDKLKPEDISIMRDSGLVEFGAHTLDHVNLTQLSSAEAQRQITASRERVIELAGACRSFAYPFGRFLPVHTNMVQAAGFDSAVSVRKTIEPLSAANRFSLPRISTNGKMDALQMRVALAKGRYRL